MSVDKNPCIQAKGEPCKLAAVDFVNTEACEQFFSWLGSIRRCVVNQNIEVFRFLVTELVTARNCASEAGQLNVKI